MRDLWVSRRNGYRRRGTSVLELRELFMFGITASSINEPLQSCFYEDDAISILDKMHQLDFDTIGALSKNPVIYHRGDHRGHRV